MNAFDENAGADGQQPPTTEELLAELLRNQQEHRAEVQALREEVAANRRVPQQVQAVALSPEELLAARLDEISQHSHYCPGCGRLYDYQRECNGKPEAPHPPIEVVSTDELRAGDPVAHTAAPNTDKLG